MVRFFVYPIEVYYYEQGHQNEPVSPYVAFGLLGGFIVGGFIAKTLIVRLVRKHV